jgi:ribosomal protein S18 acetylase RimI-like enzyme
MFKKRDALKKVDDITLIEGNFHSLWDTFGRLPGAEYSKQSDVIRFISGVPYPLCNDVVHSRFNRDKVGEQIKATLSPFQERNLPMLWWVGPSAEPADLGKHLEDHGLVFVEEVAGMVLRMDDLDAPSSVPGLIIEEVGDDRALDAWSQAFSKGFEMPDRAVSFFRNAICAIGLDPESPYRHYIGSLDGLPVACSSVYMARGVAGIYNVTTLPEAQHRGVGAAMTLRPLIDAREKGCFAGILQATEAGLNLYKKLGFQECCGLSIYMLKTEM